MEIKTDLIGKVLAFSCLSLLFLASSLSRAEVIYNTDIVVKKELASNSTTKVTSLDDSILILSTNNDSLNDVISGIKDELDDILTINIAYNSEEKFDIHIQSLLARYKPDMLVLLGNETINNYIAFQEAHPNEKYPPAMLLAALYIDELAKKVKNVTGIRYEIPLVTSGVNLRSLTTEPIKKIGVVHRDWLTDYVRINAEYALSEGLEIVPVVVPSDSRKMDRIVGKSIKKLSSKVDAIWVLNDNVLLTKDVIVNAWIPELDKFSKPVIVGVESLVETRFKIGTLSVSPDHYALGTQAASKILDMQYDNWILNRADIEQPFSVKKVFNQVVSKKRKIGVNTSRFGELDRVIE